MDQLGQVVSLMKTTTVTIKLYLEFLEKTGFSGSSPELYEYIVNSTDILEKIKASDLTPEQTETFKHIFEMYFTIMYALDTLNVIEEIFELNKFDESKIGSTSSSIMITSKHVHDMMELLDSISIQIDRIKSLVQSISLEYVFINSITITYSSETVDTISSIYKSYVADENGIYVIELYFKILDRIYIETVDKPGSKPIVKHINDTINTLKYDLLNTEQYQSIVDNLNKANSDLNAIQTLVQTYRLVPTEYRSIDAILDELGISEPKNTSSDLKQRLTAASGLTKYGFIVISKITKNPIIQSADRIINDAYISEHKLHQPSNMGVNAVAVERSKTIEIDAPPQDVSSGILYIGKNVEFYYILQTIDGVKYTIMTPWGPDSNILYVPAGFKLQPSKKLEMYNTILNDNILRNLHKPFISTGLTTQDEVKREDAYWNSVRANVKKFILGYYREYLTEYKVIRMATVKSMMLDDKSILKQINYITQLAMLDLTSATKQLESNSTTADQFRSELAMLWLNESESITRRYKSTLEELLDENKVAIERSLGTAHKLAMINHVLDAISKIVDEHLKIFINRKSGIFITLQNIIDVLEKTLLQ